MSRVNTSIVRQHSTRVLWRFSPVPQPPDGGLYDDQVRRRPSTGRPSGHRILRRPTPRWTPDLHRDKEGLQPRGSPSTEHKGDLPFRRGRKIRRVDRDEQDRLRAGARSFPVPLLDLVPAPFLQRIAQRLTDPRPPIQGVFLFLAASLFRLRCRSQIPVHRNNAFHASR